MSFTQAAVELNVSQAAASAAVKSLEHSLALQLFVRGNNRVELTEAGKRLYGDVAIGFGHIGQSLETLLSIRHDPHVTVSSSTAFGSHWVLPRLPAFRLRHPSIDLRIQTSDRDTDLNAEKIPLGIRRGTGAWPEYESVPFAHEVLFPVCSPDYLRSADPVTRLRDLPRRTLIHLEEPYRPRPAWRDWFAHHGFSYV
ncbi:MAG: LysR substrate-binding domain-containing protein, partial [Dongiaceae bacterium]